MVSCMEGKKPGFSGQSAFKSPSGPGKVPTMPGDPDRQGRLGGAGLLRQQGNQGFPQTICRRCCTNQPRKPAIQNPPAGGLPNPMHCARRRHGPIGCRGRLLCACPRINRLGGGEISRLSSRCHERQIVFMGSSPEGDLGQGWPRHGRLPHAFSGALGACGGRLPSTSRFKTEMRSPP